MAMEVRLGKSWVVGSLTLHWASSNIAWSPSLFLVPFSWYFLWQDRLGMVVCSGVFMGFWCGLQRRDRHGYGDGFACGFLYICCSWWWWRVSVVVGMGDVGMVVADVSLFDYFLMGL